MRKISGTFLILLLPLAAPAAAPRLVSVTPTGGQRGTDVQLVFSGERLQDTEEVVFYEPGLEVERLNLVTNRVVRARLKIGEHCALGEHHLRLRTASGVSDLRTFFVGPYPVVAEIEPNDTPAQAQKIRLNTTVTGVITAEDVDCFAVEARQGQLLSAEVEGMRLGRGAFDPRLALRETNGTVLADVDDTWLAMQDPFISLIAPHDGTYIFQLREATWGGDANCHYRLHLGNFPRPTAVYPPGGEAGQLTGLRFYSEATDNFDEDVTLPALPQEKFGVFAERDPLVAPTPNWIRVSPFPNVLSPGGNTDRPHAASVTLGPPFALNGVISLRGETDWFRFPAKKGVPLELNVYARQLRSPLDSVLEVFDSCGRSVAVNDDANGSVDSALKFTPEQDTNYFVSIRDSLGHFGPDFTYRVEVTPATARVAVKIPEVSRNDTQSRQFIVVPQGNRYATLISAKRENFNGELRFGAEPLPPGLTLAAETLPRQAEAEPLLFEAAPGAPVGGRLVDLTATGTNGGGRVTGHFRQNADLVEGPNNTTYYSTSVDELYVAVVREAPFQLHIVEPKAPLVQGGTLELQITAQRLPGFDEPIEVTMVWNPPGVASQTEATIPKGATNVICQLSAADTAESRAWKIAVTGHAPVNGGEVYVSSQLAPLEVAAPFLAGKIQTLAVNPGKAATLVVDLQQLRPFAGNAKIRLSGLPERVTAREQEITKDDPKATFPLTVDANCAAGSFRNLFCTVEITQDGETIAQNLAAGGILRVVPAKRETLKLADAREEKR